MTWTPLLTTPPYPSYAGNMADDRGQRGPRPAARLRLQRRSGDGDVEAVRRAADVSHDFAGFWQVAEQQAESRIYGGIHYRFDNVAGQQIGRSAAEFVFANYMTRRDRWDD